MKENQAIPSRGILVIAAGHPYYGRMAHNLAVSIKVNFPETKIALAYAGRGIDHIKSMFDLNQWFDHLIEIPEKCFYQSDLLHPEWIKIKLHLNELTPFDETIFLDADMLWLQTDPNKLFEDLKDVEFTVNNNKFLTVEEKKIVEEHAGFSAWADVDQVVKKYKLNDTRYYSIHSEMIYFKKTDRVKDFFERAQKVYADPKVKPIVFAGAIPDEFALEVAISQSKLFPHASPYRPIFWQATEQFWMTAKECAAAGFYAYSVAGNNYNFHVKNQYDHLIKSYYQKAGLHHVYLLRQKSDFLPERIKI